MLTPILATHQYETKNRHVEGGNEWWQKKTKETLKLKVRKHTSKGFIFHKHRGTFLDNYGRIFFITLFHFQLP